jgi:hypothetical protein
MGGLPFPAWANARPLRLSASSGLSVTRLKPYSQLNSPFLRIQVARDLSDCFLLPFGFKVAPKKPNYQP